jgi:hypothetical protein
VGSSPDWIKPKTVKLVFVAFLLSTQHLQERSKTDWLGIRIMCPELLLFNANSAIFQLDHGENKLMFNEMMMRSALY